jgi:hypothetical protein
MSEEPKIERRKEYGTFETQLATLSERVCGLTDRICDVRTALAEMRLLLEKKYVEKVEFDPVKRIVYGVVILILTGVAVAVINLVVKK